MAPAIVAENSDLYNAMPDGFEAAVRENIRVALTSLA
jgi:hypothetical protein